MAGAGAVRRARPRRRPHRLARASASRPRPTRWSARCARPGKRVGVLAVDPSSPFSGGALLGDRVRMQDHALDPDVYIRSMASRGHLGGLAWATPQALRVLDAAGCDVVLVETVGVGQCEVEVAGAGRHHARAAGARAWATASRPRRPGSSRSATSSSSTRPTATAPTRSAATCASMLALGERPRGRLAAADRQDRRQHGRGHRRGGRRRSTEHRAWLERVRRARAARRTRRARDEIEAIAVTALRARWGDVHGGAELDELAAAVVGGRDRPVHRRRPAAGEPVGDRPFEVTISAHRGSRRGNRRSTSLRSLGWPVTGESGCSSAVASASTSTAAASSTTCPSPVSPGGCWR